MTSAYLALEDFITRRTRARHVPRLRRLIEPGPGRRILDVGGGTGAAADLYAAGSEVVILEPSTKKLAHGRDRRGAIRFVEGRAETIPFPDDTFDRVVVLAAFHHFRDQPLALREIRRVLTDGGRFVLVDIDPDTPNGRLSRFFENDVLGGACSFQTPGRVLELAAEAGLRNITVERVSSVYFVVATR